MRTGESRIDPSVKRNGPLAALSDDALIARHNASQELLRWQSILAKTNDNAVTDLLRGVDQLEYNEAYPSDTVEDHETGCQFYFHAHDDRTEEYGHFHTYVMESAIPPDAVAAKPATAKADDPYRTHCHLVGVSVNSRGIPTSLFTLNHWSAHEACYGLGELEKILAQFDITHAIPSFPVNRWISELLRMYRIEILQLFAEREKCLEQLQLEQPDIPAMANESVDVTSALDISIESDALIVQHEMLNRGLIES